MLAALLMGCGSDSDRPAVSIYVAASLTDALGEIGACYEAAHPVDLHFNFASSGALAQQILAARKADLFLSASPGWMDAIAPQITPGSRLDLLSNRLVVVAHAESGHRYESFLKGDFGFLAIGDPAHVPAGKYARDWLESTGLWPVLADKVSPAPDIRAALAQAEGNPDVIALVYQSDVATRPDSVRILHRVPAKEASPIVYPIALLEGHASAAQGFYDFLLGPEAARVFREHGFSLLED